MLAAGALTALVLLSACGEGGGVEARADPSQRSAVTGQDQLTYDVLTEADSGKVIETEMYIYDIGAPDRKGLEIELSGDDASPLRWRFAEKPDALILEWYAVDGELAFETDGLVGNPATAAKVLEFRGNARGEAAIVLELIDRDPGKRAGDPAKRLEYTFNVKEPPGEGWRPIKRATGPRGTHA